MTLLDRQRPVIAESPPPRLIDRIAELWAENRSLSEIGKALNATRGVVVGAIWRARRAGDPRFQRRAPKPKPRKLKPVGEAVGAVRNAAAPVEKSCAPRLLIDLGPLDCRWPVGEAADGRHLFCGQLELLAGHIARSAVRASALHSRHFALGDERAAGAGPVNHFAAPLASGC